MAETLGALGTHEGRTSPEASVAPEGDGEKLIDGLGAGADEGGAVSPLDRVDGEAADGVGANGTDVHPIRATMTDSSVAMRVLRKWIPHGFPR